MSRNGKDLSRYFPEVVDAVSALPLGTVLDGELVVVVDDRLDWDALSARVHPAASRVVRLAAEMPAAYVAFDCLSTEHGAVIDDPLHQRRQALDRAFGRGTDPRLVATESTTDPATAERWFEQYEGAGLDGIVGKRLDEAYQPGRRTMIKLKHRRTADVVVDGLRWHARSTPAEQLVGALRVGAYDGERFVRLGGIGAFPVAERRRLADELAPLIEHAEAVDRTRWTRADASGWTALQPVHVVEIAYDQMGNGRLRHPATLLRWRPDRDPASCGLAQFESAPDYPLARIMGGSKGRRDDGTP
jgi:ATP-dependent DNA ligase